MLWGWSDRAEEWVDLSLFRRETLPYFGVACFLLISLNLCNYLLYNLYLEFISGMFKLR